MGTTWHTTTNISGLLRNMKGKKITFMQDENGDFMTDKDVRKSLAEMQAVAKQINSKAK